MSGQDHVKVENAAFLHFELSGSLNGLQKAEAQSAGKCLRGALREYKGNTLKGQCQGQVTKGYYTIKVTNMPCNTCFLDHFAHRYGE